MEQCFGMSLIVIYQQFSWSENSSLKNRVSIPGLQPFSYTKFTKPIKIIVGRQYLVQTSTTCASPGTEHAGHLFLQQKPTHL